MSNEIVKYHRGMNEIAFRKFTSVELDLFFTICQSVRDKDTKEIRYSFDELKEKMKYTQRNNRLFIEMITNTYQKMLSLINKIETETETIYFVLFNLFAVNDTKEYVRIKVNEDFRFILNDLTKDFVRFELEEFLDLKSTYSKSMYRLLKQYRTTGYHIVPIEEFRRKLDVPDGYRMSEIDKYVLKPILNELSSHFKNLEIKKIKAKKGRKIEFLEFYFDKEKIEKEKPTIDYEIANTEITQEEIDAMIIDLRKG